MCVSSYVHQNDLAHQQYLFRIDSNCDSIILHRSNGEKVSPDILNVPYGPLVPPGSRQLQPWVFKSPLMFLFCRGVLCFCTEPWQRKGVVMWKFHLFLHTEPYYFGGENRVFSFWTTDLSFPDIGLAPFQPFFWWFTYHRLMNLIWNSVFGSNMTSTMQHWQCSMRTVLRRSASAVTPTGNR